MSEDLAREIAMGGTSGWIRIDSPAEGVVSPSTTRVKIDSSTATSPGTITREDPLKR